MSQTVPPSYRLGLRAGIQLPAPPERSRPYPIRPRRAAFVQNRASLSTATTSFGWPPVDHARKPLGMEIRARLIQKSRYELRRMGERRSSAGEFLLSSGAHPDLL